MGEEREVVSLVTDDEVATAKSRERQRTECFGHRWMRFRAWVLPVHRRDGGFEASRAINFVLTTFHTLD